MQPVVASLAGFVFVAGGLLFLAFSLRAGGDKEVSLRLHDYVGDHAVWQPQRAPVLSFRQAELSGSFVTRVIQPRFVTPQRAETFRVRLSRNGFTAVSNLLPAVPTGYNIILYTVNNDSTSGALRALAASGRADNDKTLIAGLGGDKTGVDNLRSDPRWVAEGDIFFNWWGEYAVAMAQSLAKGIKPPADVTALPQIVLSKDTVDQYLLPDSVEAKQLPALDSTNEFLKQGGFLQIINNIPGLQ